MSAQSRSLMGARQGLPKKRTVTDNDALTTARTEARGMQPGSVGWVKRNANGGYAASVRFDTGQRPDGLYEVTVTSVNPEETRIRPGDRFAIPARLVGAWS